MQARFRQDHKAHHRKCLYLRLANQKEIIPLFKHLFVFDYSVGPQPRYLSFAAEMKYPNGWSGGGDGSRMFLPRVSTKANYV